MEEINAYFILAHLFVLTVFKGELIPISTWQLTYTQYVFIHSYVPRFRHCLENPFLKPNDMLKFISFSFLHSAEDKFKTVEETVK